MCDASAFNRGSDSIKQNREARHLLSYEWPLARCMLSGGTPHRGAASPRALAPVYLFLHRCRGATLERISRICCRWPAR